MESQAVFQAKKSSQNVYIELLPSLTSHLANLTFSTLGSLTRTNPSDMPMEPMSPMDEDDDGEEEPILSGFGSLSKECVH